MQTRNRFSIQRAALHVIASLSLAAFILAAGLAKADDTTPITTSTQTSASKQQSAARSQDTTASDAKDAKAAAEYLATPVTQLNFYGSATVGCASTIGKHAQGGMYSDFEIGTGIKLSKNVTMNLQFGVARYPNFFLFR